MNTGSADVVHGLAAHACETSQDQGLNLQFLTLDRRILYRWTPPGKSYSVGLLKK